MRRAVSIEDLRMWVLMNLNSESPPREHHNSLVAFYRITRAGQKALASSDYMRKPAAK